MLSNIPNAVATAIPMNASDTCKLCSPLTKFPLIIRVQSVSSAEKENMPATLGRLMQKYPEWKGPVIPEESVNRVLEVVEKSKPEQSRQFLNQCSNTTKCL
jgi:hypothetical protein